MSPKGKGLFEKAQDKKNSSCRLLQDPDGYLADLSISVYEDAQSSHRASDVSEDRELLFPPQVLSGQCPGQFEEEETGSTRALAAVKSEEAGALHALWSLEAIGTLSLARHSKEKPLEMGSKLSRTGRIKAKKRERSAKDRREDHSPRSARPSTLPKSHTRGSSRDQTRKQPGLTVIPKGSGKLFSH